MYQDYCLQSQAMLGGSEDRYIRDPCLFLIMEPFSRLCSQATLVFLALGKVITCLYSDYTEFVCEKSSWEDFTYLPPYSNSQYI